jgi:hypothetical protein
MFFYSVFLSPLSSLFFLLLFSFLFSLCLPLTLSALLSQIPHSIFLSLTRTRTPTLNGSLSSWVVGPWVVRRPCQRQTKELNRLVVVRVESAIWYLFAWGLCLGGCHGIRWLVSLPLLGNGCKQNGLWWV